MGTLNANHSNLSTLLDVLIHPRNRLSEPDPTVVEVAERMRSAIQTSTATIGTSDVEDEQIRLALERAGQLSGVLP